MDTEAAGDDQRVEGCAAFGKTLRRKAEPAEAVTSGRSATMASS